MSNETKNDIAWMSLFDKYRIINKIENKGFFNITASQINEFREARLMTKFDHKINLPQIFKADGLSILPITRGSYTISHFEAYKNFEDEETNIVRASFPEYLESIDYEDITSESTAINCAYVSGILADFIEDEELLPTVDGRMSSKAFSFNIRNNMSKSIISLDVENSQIEIDGGFEGINYLSLIEAKNFISEDFLIRQLYYPYRLWSSKISKKINSIFLVYSNGVFNLYKYEFQEPELYNSLLLVKQRKYSIEAIDITLDDIIAISKKTKYVEEPAIPFPQADNFNRVANLCELLSANEMTKEEITLNYAFDKRQTNYYTDAGRYLGFIDKRKENGEIIFSLTQEGQRLLQTQIKTRHLRFVEAILRHRAFNETLKLYLQKAEIPSKEMIVKIMKKSNLYKVIEESTYNRRASTIIGWINWILELQS